MSPGFRLNVHVLTALLSVGTLLGACKGKPREREATLTPVADAPARVELEVTRELLARYARYRERYAKLLEETRERRRGALVDAVPAGGVTAVRAQPAASFHARVADALEAEGLDAKEAQALQRLVADVITSELVIEQNLAAANGGAQEDPAMAQLYREQQQKQPERIAAARAIYGKAAVERVLELKSVLAAAEQRVIDAGR